jgi:hypothetical protein
LRSGRRPYGEFQLDQETRPISKSFISKTKQDGLINSYRA